MDYIAKMNLHRIALNDEQLYNDYLNYLGNVITKVTTTHYELLQAKSVAVAYIENNQLPATLYGRLRDIAICFYRLKF